MHIDILVTIWLSGCVTGASDGRRRDMSARGWIQPEVAGAGGRGVGPAAAWLGHWRDAERL